MNLYTINLDFNLVRCVLSNFNFVSSPSSSRKGPYYYYHYYLGKGLKKP